MALCLFGVTDSNVHAGEGIAGAELVVLRDLAAICGPNEHRAPDTDDAAARGHNAVIASFATLGPVLPAPVGVVFQSPASVRRWLELHYSALSDALTYVENRVAARVHARATPPEEGVEVAGDLVATAAEGFRALRRVAVATLPLRADRATGVLSSAAFLVEELNWKDFAAEVDAQTKSTPNIQYELTGPWVAYDFVQMRLGA